VVGNCESPWQGDLGLERDDPAGKAPAMPAPVNRPASQGRKTEPRLGPAAAAGQATVSGSRRGAAQRPPADSADDKTAEVAVPERLVKADQPKEPRRWSARKVVAEGRAEQRSPGRQSRGSGGSDGRKAEQAVEELIMVSVVAPKGKPFVGGGLVEALRGRGLRYGDMNIFHRVDPMTRVTLYSVANVVEPGTFDMADLDNFRSPGVCFFMQLPGPDQPMDTFEDMLKVARDVALRVGGELKDEQRSVMTGQTVEHYRQRISDFCRRRMSKRA
jgi:cell division protein ZipA